MKLMKILVTMTMMTTFLQPVKADMLSDIINGRFDFSSNIFQEEEDSKELGEDHGLDNGEYYSWDDLYLCTYCYDTEVIIDPYGSNDEIWFGY